MHDLFEGSDFTEKEKKLTVIKQSYEVGNQMTFFIHLASWIQ